MTEAPGMVPNRRIRRLYFDPIVFWGVLRRSNTDPVGA